MRSLFTALILSVFLLSANGAHGADPDGWQSGYTSDGQRYIPVALWAGAEWDGKHAITLPKTDMWFGKNRNKRVFGPRSWVHLATGTSHVIYERHNRGKIQYFAVNRAGDGLGRVYDNRYSRYCPDEVKFPLGLWKQGEKRTYDIDCEGRKRHIEVTITRLNFTFDGVSHSLEFHWQLDSGTKRGSNNVYTYSPGMGLVRVREN